MKEKWLKMYELAKEYFLEYGNLDVSVRFMTKNEEKLGSWIRIQRLKYKNRNLSKEEKSNTFSPLTDEQVELLERIGMKWDIIDSKWNKMYELAKKYFLEHGNLDVPKRFIAENGEKLGDWISGQRRAYKNRTIQKEERTSTYSPLTVK